MHEPISYLAGLREHASRAMSAAFDVQRLITKKVEVPGLSGAATEIEKFASKSLMTIAQSAQHLYASELKRSIELTLARVPTAPSLVEKVGGRGNEPRP
ncbi:hypothetical protein [Variovorax sp. W2I14]|uniref:hypothetical protein n=1 Tax=Variovorax sp. W2I14 TaxID=3042290 RepID=UPI003D19BD14